MTVSSRTPEGEPNRCPVCHTSLRIEPSRPAGDAPCPACGTLLWFTGVEIVRHPRTQSSSVAKFTAYRDDSSRNAGKDGASLVTYPLLHAKQSVRVLRGIFAEMEGHVLSVEPHTERVTVEIKLYGRPVPVELQRSCVEAISPQSEPA